MGQKGHFSLPAINVQDVLWCLELCCLIIVHRLLGLNVLMAIQLKCIDQHGFVTTEYRCIYSSAYPYYRLCGGSVRGLGNWVEGSLYYHVKLRRTQNFDENHHCIKINTEITFRSLLLMTVSGGRF